MNESRDFKGIWIPKELWLNKELTLLEKCIFVEIDSLDNENNCIASNEYFAEFCDCSESKITKAIRRLQELNMIEILSFDGRHRRIRVVKSTMQGSKKYDAESQKVRAINIDNNIVNKKQSKSKDLDCGENFNFGHSKSDTVTSSKEAEKFKDYYNEHCSNLPKVVKLTDKRIKAVKNLIKKYSWDDIITVFDSANDSDFLTGNNDRGWKADIDFLLREDKFINILEGKYGGRKKRRFEHEGKCVPITAEEKKRMKEFHEELRKNGKQVTF